MFVHLHTHSAFSLAEGALGINGLVNLCKESNMPAIALTDTNNLFGALNFSNACVKSGIQPIIGCQLFLEDDFQSAINIPKKDSFNIANPLVLLAKTEKGYKSLVKLSSTAFRRDYEDNQGVRITFEDIGQLDDNSDLIAMPCGLNGGVTKLIQQNKQSQAEQYIDNLGKKCELFINLSRQSDLHNQSTESKIIQLADSKNIPIVATNEVFFSNQSMMEAHDALLCIAEGKYVSQTDRRQSNVNFDFKSQQDMGQLFSNLPEAIENTLIIAQKCSYFLENKPPTLPPFPTAKGEEKELEAQAYDGLEQRLIENVFPYYKNIKSGQTEEEIRKIYKDRLSHELVVINKMGYAGYFLIVADFIKWSNKAGIPVGPGRGSGAGSLVAWSLTITGIDPIRFKLIFERFLNPERVSMPDFDIDFCQDRRDEVIEYVQERYGKDHVAQIITFGKLQPRAVIRDVGRVLQMPYGQIDKISKMIPNNPNKPLSLQEAIDQEESLSTVRDSEESTKRLFKIALELEGLYRHASTHAAGIVISGGPLEETVALYYDPRSDIPATQFSMKDVENAGLVKFDFLGLKTLTVISDTLKLLKNRDIEIIADQIPIDDKNTFKFLQKVETIGIFQLESSGMRDVLRKLQPEKLEEIMALIALYRPGPMDDIPRYLACKHGREEVKYPDPMLEDILKETFGVMVYQEQVMHIAQKMAGYTPGAADLLRRAMGKKIQAEMDAQRQIFVEGSMKNGFTEKKASKIFDQIAKFAGYGFNKSHSAPYALIGYQTAYLKANYPVEFMTTTMTHDRGNTDKIALLYQEVLRMDIPMLPPDVNESQVLFSVEKVEEKLGIRYALSALKNVGDAAMEQLVNERNKNGKFKNVIDFARRLDSKVINKKQMEGLIIAGAFDGLHPNRNQLIENLDIILPHAGLVEQEKNSLQKNLFQSNQDTNIESEVKLKETKPWSTLEKLENEYQAIGFYLTAHPLSVYKNSLSKKAIVKSSDIIKRVSNENSKFDVAGVLVSKKEHTSAKSGKKFAFLMLSDEHGTYEVSAFGENLVQYRDQFEEGKCFIISVNGRLNNEEPRLVINEMHKLSEVQEEQPRSIKIEIDNIESIKKLKQILQNTESKKPKTTVRICVNTEHGKVILRLKEKYAITSEVMQQLQFQFKQNAII